MELYQIRYFLAVSRTLNFTQAADECNVTQPALTRAIKKLEGELGGDLFRRERTRSHLTELGKAMVPLLQQSFDAATAAKAEAENFERGAVAPLHVGISETVPASLLADVLTELVKDVPGADLSIVRQPADEVERLLEAGEIDFGILAANGNFGWDRIHTWPLFEEDFVACEPSALTGAAAQSDAARQIYVARPYCEHREATEAFLSGFNPPWERKHSVKSDADVATVIDATGATALLPRSAATNLQLDWTALDDDPPRRTVVLIEAIGRQHNAAGSRFVRLMRANDWAGAAGAD